MAYEKDIPDNENTIHNSAVQSYAIAKLQPRKTKNETRKLPIYGHCYCAPKLSYRSTSGIF